MQGNRGMYELDIGVGPHGVQVVREKSEHRKWGPLCAPIPEKATQGVGKVYYNRKGNKGSQDVVGKGCEVVSEWLSDVGQLQRCGGVQLGQI